MNEADLRKSVACFGSAIEQDSQYALAHSGLADVYSLFARMGMLPAGDACRRARDFATTAIQMDDRLPEAHASLADVKKLFDWDYAGAEAGYIRALELDQN